MERRKIIFIIVTAVLVLLIIIAGIAILTKQPTRSVNEPTAQKVTQLAEKSATTDELPWLDESQGGGVDTQAPVVKLSQASIEKLASQLPYNKTMTTEDGIEVEISIPPTDILSNDWTLLVHIFGPDYQIPKDDPEYGSMRNAFLAGASEVYTFLGKNDIALDTIIIDWGDRALVRDRSVEWLK